MSIKKQKPHSSNGKKASASSTSPRAKKAATKASKRVGKSKAKTRERPAWLKKRDELTLKMFQEIYEDYQEGKFHRIL